uniref:Uncharacterized protein n=1 Tax=Wuchereria bancrofti TaxID=6293 RepID=A0AAF5PH15_WUCBA
MIENQSKILKGPVIIEILLDVTTLKLAQPSELQDKPVSTSISAVVTKINAASPVFISAELGNASDRQVVMYNALIKCISSREIVQQEQLLCDLKTGFPFSERCPEPLSVESENFLKFCHPQLMIYAEIGFQIDNRCNNQSDFDILC